MWSSLASDNLVRPLAGQSFEIVTGARHYRAPQIAEAPTVPVLIVNHTDGTTASRWRLN